MWKHHASGEDQRPHRPPFLRWRGLVLRRLRQDEGGATAIEFSFIAIGLFYIIIGIVEFAMCITVGNSLEAATNLSSRLGKTGYVDEQAQLTQEETIYAEIERRVGPMIDMDKLEIDHEVYNDFESLTNPDILEDGNGDGDTDDPGEWTDVDGDGFKDGADGVGGSGSVVVYRISYPWELMTPLIGQFVGDDGTITLTAYSVVKNEPY